MRSGPTINPDNTCDSCREISAGTSLDVLEIDAASNRGIDQIRELREMVRYAPASSRYKVVILDEAHQLTDEASNALLKTLEEPPERVVFILATTRAEDLVETIKSRAQLFQFRSLTFQEIAGEIERIAKAENLKIDSGAVAVLARAAEGSMRDGLSLLEQAIAYAGETITDAQVRELLGVVAESVLDDLVEAIAAQSAERALGLVHRLIADGQNLQHFCREAIRHFRNLLVVRVCGADSNLVAAPKDERPRLAEQAAQFGEEDLTRFFNILLATDDDLRRKPDPRLHLELGLLRLINAQRLAPLEEALAELRGEARPRPARPDPAHRRARRRPRKRLRPPHHRVRLRSAWLLIRPRKHRQRRPPLLLLRRPRAPPRRRLCQRPRHESSRARRKMLPMVSRQCNWERSKRLCKNQDCSHRSSNRRHVAKWKAASSVFSSPPENRALTEMLPREAMERLRTAVNQVVGQPLRVCVKLDPVRAGVSRSSELQARFEQDPIVRAMLEKFGGRISRVKHPGEE